MGNFIEESRKDWVTNPVGRQLTNEEIMVGCLQRMAAAAERTAAAAEAQLKQTTALELRQRTSEANAKELDRKLTSLKGSLTKVRKELKGE